MSSHLHHLVRPRWSRAAAAVAVALSLWGGVIDHAEAQSVKAISVEPTNGVQAGTKLTVSAPEGTFPAGADLFVGICSNDASLPTDGSGCAAVGGGGAINTKAKTDGSLAQTELTVTVGELNPGGPSADRCPPTPDQVAAGTSCVVTVTTFDGQVAGFRFLTFDPKAAEQSANQSTSASGSSTSASGSSTQSTSSLSTELGATRTDDSSSTSVSAAESAQAEATPSTKALLVASASESNTSEFSLTGLGWTPGAALGAFKVEFCQALDCTSDRVTVDSLTTDAAGGLSGKVTVARPDPCVACALKVTDTASGDVATTTLGQAGAPTLGITPASGKKGAVITVLGTGWRPGGTISIALVGPPYDGSAVGTASNITANDTGQISGTLTVAARDLEVAGPGGALAVAAADLGDPDVLEGLKEPYVVPFRAIASTDDGDTATTTAANGGNSPLRVLSAKLVGSGPLLSWLGGRPERTLEVTVQNVSDLAIDNYNLRLESMKSIVIDKADMPNLRPLEAGAKATYKIPVKLRPLAFGRSTVPGEFRSADGVAKFRAKSGFTFPWLLAALLLGIIGLVIFMSRGGEDDDDDDWVASLSDPEGTPAVSRSSRGETRTPPRRDEATPVREPRAGLSVVPDPQDHDNSKLADDVSFAPAVAESEPTVVDVSERSVAPLAGERQSIDWLADEPTEPFTPRFDPQRDAPQADAEDRATAHTPAAGTNPFSPTEPFIAEPVVREPVVREPVVREPVVREPVAPEPPAIQFPGPAVDQGGLAAAGAAGAAGAVAGAAGSGGAKSGAGARESERAGLSITPVSKTITLRRASLGDGMTVFHGKIDDVSVTDQRPTSLGWTAVIEPETMDDLRGGVLHVRPKLGRVVEGSRQGLRRSSPSVAEPGLPSPLLEAKSGSGKGTYSTGATVDLVLPSRVSDTKTLAINVVLSAVPDDTPVQSAG